MVVDLDKILQEGYICNGHRDLLYFILYKSIFLHFVYHVTKFYSRYINSDDRKNMLIMMGLVPNQSIIFEGFIIQKTRRHTVIGII